MDEEEGLTGKQKAFLVIGGLIAVGAAVKYGTDKHKEMKKQRALEEYLEHIGLLEAAKRRLIRIMQDPNKTEDDFLDAVKEEKILLGILSETE